MSNRVAPQPVGYQTAGMQPGVYGGQPVIAQPGSMGAPGVPGGNPGAVIWMAKPQAAAGCPPGLEYLTKLNQIYIRQQLDVLDVITNMHMGRKYRLTNKENQQVYFVTEERQFACCKSPGFVMNISDSAGMNVLRLQQDSNCCNEPLCSCLDCCAAMVEVQAPIGHTVGYCKQKCGFCGPRYGVLDAQYNDVIDISGPCCTCPCSDIEFMMTSSRDGSDAGSLTKRYQGLAHMEAYVRPDNFELQFPITLDVKTKATLIGASFLINALHLKEAQRSHRNRHHHHHRRHY